MTIEIEKNKAENNRYSISLCISCLCIQKHIINKIAMIQATADMRPELVNAISTFLRISSEMEWLQESLEMSIVNELLVNSANLYLCPLPTT